MEPCRQKVSKEKKIKHCDRSYHFCCKKKNRPQDQHVNIREQSLPLLSSITEAPLTFDTDAALMTFSEWKVFPEMM